MGPRRCLLWHSDWHRFFFGVIVCADEVDAKIAEIEQVLRATKLEAVEQALESTRQLAGDLVKNGDRRQDELLARQAELEAELRTLKVPGNDPADGNGKKQLLREFEAVDAGGGWWWVDKQKPAIRGPWYRLDKKNKIFEHFFKDGLGQTKKYPPFSPTYEVIGLKRDDENVILIRMTSSPTAQKPHEEMVYEFDRKTGVIETPFGFSAKPKRAR